MARHVKALGLGGARAYLRWCREFGFAETLEKTAEERAEELDAPARRRAEIDERAKLHRNPRRFLEKACAGEIDPQTVNRTGWSEAALAIARSKDEPETRESLKDFLLHVERVSDLVFGTAMLQRQRVMYLEGLIRLHDRRRQWIRPFDEWKPESHNIKRQFASLVRHLLALYETPAFLDSVWLRGDKGSHRYRDWFIHVSRGRNMRTAKTPYPMTRAMAHHFMAAPDNYSIEGALMLADIRSLNGGPRIAEALMATRLGASVERDEERRAFWLSVYRFFIDNPMLDLRHVGPVVDFLAFQKFETQEVMVGPGEVELRPPPQPNLSMSRRTAESLLRQVEAWHGELRRTKGADSRFWAPSGFKGLTMATGPRDRPEERTTWRVKELLSGQELVDEGRAMRHCVATYADSCVRGAYSIWSVTRQEADDTPRRALTVSVDSKGSVSEARGPRNSLPTKQEIGVLEAWMKAAGLKPGTYLYGW